MYALVQIKGRQYKAQAGATLKVDRFAEEKGSGVVLDQVLLVNDGTTTRIGAPYVAGVTVRTTVADHGRDPKIIVYKYKKRKSYRRMNGHRQGYSLLKVESIGGV